MRISDWSADVCSSDRTLDPSIQAWRDIWSGGHGVGLIDDIPMTAALVDRLEGEYLAAARAMGIVHRAARAEQPRHRNNAMPRWHGTTGGDSQATRRAPGQSRIAGNAG